MTSGREAIHQGITLNELHKQQRDKKEEEDHKKAVAEKENASKKYKKSITIIIIQSIIVAIIVAANLKLSVWMIDTASGFFEVIEIISGCVWLIITASISLVCVFHTIPMPLKPPNKKEITL